MPYETRSETRTIQVTEPLPWAWLLALVGTVPLVLVISVITYQEGMKSAG